MRNSGVVSWLAGDFDSLSQVSARCMKGWPKIVSKQSSTIRALLKKYREFWISADYVYSIFDFFVALCWYSCFSFMPTSTAILNVQLIFDSCFACTCFGSSSIFAYSKKWIKESVSNFVWKTKLSARTHSECWLWHMVKLPWTEATFIGGTKCFPRAEKMWTTKSVPDARARQQQTKTLMKWRK